MKSKFGMHPVTLDTVKVAGLLVLIGILFGFWDFPFHPIVNIAMKGFLISAIYVGILYRFRISEDVFGMISRFGKRK